MYSIALLLLTSTTPYILAASCPVFYNCPCAVKVNGCYTCPCHDNSTTPHTVPGKQCPHVDFLKCPEGCLYINNATQCLACNCTLPAAPLLECYSCTATRSATCLSVSQCRSDQECYTSKVLASGRISYNFGCIAKQTCRGHHGIIGRRDGTRCFKCCAKDWCNKNLCT